MKTQMTLIAVQDEYIETINLGIQRWGHRKDGGHMSRIGRGARNKGMKKLGKLGFTPAQAQIILRDAHGMAELIRNADDQEFVAAHAECYDDLNHAGTL